jgi:hypothetical protein
MINFIKNLFKKWMRIEKKEDPIVVHEVKPEHCVIHSRFRKSCPLCQEIVQ